MSKVLICLLMPLSILAQQAVLNEDETGEGEDSFETLFEHQSVGNFHIYAPPNDKITEDYFLAGNIIPKEHIDVLPKPLNRYILTTAKAPRAVSNIKGPRNGNLYIIRYPTKKGSTLGLFDMKGKKLKELKKLSYRYTKRNKNYQLDSWVIDVNKDGMLDIVQKKKISKKHKTTVKSTFFEMQRDGQLKKNKTFEVDFGKFVMQE